MVRRQDGPQARPEGALKFSQDGAGLKVKLPAEKPCEHAFALKISGLSLKRVLKNARNRSLTVAARNQAC
jgi:hypothetical protein